MNNKFGKQKPFALLDTSKYPPEVVGRYNSFITTQFDDSLSVEMQIRSIIKWAIGNFKEMDQNYNDFTEYVVQGNLKPFIQFLNDLIDYMNNFIETFDTKFQDEILLNLQKWNDDGTLETLINETLDTKYHEMDQRLTTQLAQTHKKNEQSVGWGNLTQSAREQIAGDKVAVVGSNSVGSANLIPNSVSPMKTTFARPGKNKYDGTVVAGHVNSVGRFYDRGVLYTAAVVELEPGKTYTVRRSLNGPILRAAVNEGYPELDTTLTRALVPTNTMEVTFTLGEGETHLVANMSSDVDIADWLQVQEGEVAGNHTPYSTVIDFEDRSIPTRSVQNTMGYATLTGRSQYFNVDLENEIIKTSIGGLCMINGRARNLVTGEWSFREVSTQMVFVTIDSETAEIEFAEGLAVGYDEKPNKPLIGWIRRDTGSSSFNGPHMVNGKTTLAFTEADRKAITQSNMGLPNTIVTDWANEIYKSDSEHVNVDNVSSIQIDEVYDMYDELVVDYPDYIDKELIGNDSSNLPIYKYEFVPPKPFDGENTKHIKIVYVSGTHGHEKNSAIAGALFFKELCEKWKSNDVLRVLRWNVHFVVIPVLNPSGFNVNTRVNGNGVDLNRNFTDNWTYIPESNEYNYSGEEALSELESQYMVEVMNANADATLAIDHHSFDYLSASGYGFWYGTNQYGVKKVLTGLGHQNSSILRRDYPYIVQDNTALSRIASAHNGGLANEWGARGVPSTLFETPKNFGNSKEDSQAITITAIGTLFYTTVKYNRELMVL